MTRIRVVLLFVLSVTGCTKKPEGPDRVTFEGNVRSTLREYPEWDLVKVERFDGPGPLSYQVVANREGFKWVGVASMAKEDSRPANVSANSIPSTATGPGWSVRYDQAMNAKVYQVERGKYEEVFGARSEWFRQRANELVHIIKRSSRD